MLQAELSVSPEEMVEELTRTVANQAMQIAAMQILIRKLQGEGVNNGSIES